MSSAEQAAAVRQALAVARDRGFLGPGPLEPHVEHARGFALALGGWEGPVAVGEDRHPWGEVADTSPRVVDLGSGGGLPGLVLALEWPTSRLVLVEAGERRSTLLREAVASCGLEDRVTVVHRRAEEVGHDPVHRGSYDVVVARSFAPPSVTAECAAPLLHPGGVLVVSEPPEAEAEIDTRWPTPGLAVLGMTGSWPVRGRFGYRIVLQGSACPDRFPRRVGVPAKRPLF
jgi:16S rRNA (guanine527-N7)-methyltransferase